MSGREHGGMGQRSRRGGDRGAVAVEFALVLPVLMMITFGIITAGLAYTRAIGLTNAVREGARFGATADTASGTWAQDVITRVRGTQFDDSPVLADTTTAVCAELYIVGTGRSTLTGAFSCSTTGTTPALDETSAPSVAGIAAGTCVVRVWAAREFEISVLMVKPWIDTALRTSVARYERKTC